MATKIIIGGDFCVTPQYTSNDLFSEEIIKLFGQSDLNIINLECPVVDQDNTYKIAKSGPHLQTDNKIFNQLKQLNIQVATLANNHILDFGTEGIISTIKGCQQHDILTVGAGENIAVASEPTIVEKNGLRIALVNFCEHEFSIASTNSAGANPLDIIDNLRKIKLARSMADFVLVIVHGGHEHYNLPSPRMVKQYRFFAENGADAVIGHHTHCISGYEVHNEIPIFYGLGNMLFTLPCNIAGWNNGLLVKFDAEKGSPLKWELIPIQQSGENFQLSISGGETRERILEDVKGYSQIIADNEKLNHSWVSYAMKMETQILNKFSPIRLVPGRYLRAIIKRLGLSKLIFKNNYLIPILNHIECESLFDLSQLILTQKLQNNENRDSSPKRQF